jgi:hypothetical protein
MSTKTILVLLQESRPNELPWPDDMDKDTVKLIIDRVSETFEGLNTKLTTSGAYDETIQLIDDKCTYASLMTTLIDQTIQGNTIDLVILGHGSKGSLTLHNSEQINPAKIQQIKVEAAKNNCKHINLRMVYSCTCYGSSLNEEWCDIGAQVSIGPVGNNYMPEPETTDFLLLWAEKGETAEEARSHAYDSSKAFYWLLPDPLTGLPSPAVGWLYESKGWFDSSQLDLVGEKTITKAWKYSGSPWMETSRIGVLKNDGQVFVKEEPLNGQWVLETDNCRQIALARDRIGVLDSDGQVFVKEGPLNGQWVLETDNCRQIALAGDRIGVLDNDGQVFVKEGPLNSQWVRETDNCRQIALAGDRIGVLDNDGQVFVKEGPLNSQWVLETDSCRQIALAGDRIGVLDNDGQVFVKVGPLNGQWVQESSEVQSLALETFTRITV